MGETWIALALQDDVHSVTSTMTTALRTELEARDGYVSQQLDMHSDHVCKLMEQSTKYMEDVVEGHMQHMGENLQAQEAQCREDLAELEARLQQRVAAAMVEAEARAEGKMLAFADLVKQAMVRLVGPICLTNENPLRVSTSGEACARRVPLAVCDRQLALTHEAPRPSASATDGLERDTLEADSVGHNTWADSGGGVPLASPSAGSEIVAPEDVPVDSGINGEGSKGTESASCEGGAPSSACALLARGDQDDTQRAAADPNEYLGCGDFGTEIDYGGDEEEEAPDDRSNLHLAHLIAMKPHHGREGAADRTQEEVDASEDPGWPAGDEGDRMGVDTPDEGVDDPGHGTAGRLPSAQLPSVRRYGLSCSPCTDRKRKRGCDNLQEELRRERHEHYCKYPHGSQYCSGSANGGALLRAGRGAAEAVPPGVAADESTADGIAVGAGALCRKAPRVPLQDHSRGAKPKGRKAGRFQLKQNYHKKGQPQFHTACRSHWSRQWSRGARWHSHTSPSKEWYHNARWSRQKSSWGSGPRASAALEKNHRDKNQVW